MFKNIAGNLKQARRAPGILALLALALALTACAGKSGTQIPEDGGDLAIPIADISEQAAFYPVEVQGTKMEVIAVKAPDGTIRTALNTCQVCFDSGRGYYKQSGDVLVCQNCGNRFPMSMIEVEAGGCNPVPIFGEKKTVTDVSVTISYAFLKESKEIFANWKRAD